MTTTEKKDHLKTLRISRSPASETPLNLVGSARPSLGRLCILRGRRATICGVRTGFFAFDRPDRHGMRAANS